MNEFFLTHNRYGKIKDSNTFYLPQYLMEHLQSPDIPTRITNLVRQAEQAATQDEVIHLLPSARDLFFDYAYTVPVPTVYRPKDTVKSSIGEYYVPLLEKEIELKIKTMEDGISVDWTLFNPSLLWKAFSWPNIGSVQIPTIQRILSCHRTIANQAKTEVALTFAEISSLFQYLARDEYDNHNTHPVVSQFRDMRINYQQILKNCSPGYTLDREIADRKSVV